MIRKWFPFAIVALSVLFIGLACGGSFSTANISDVVMASDPDGAQQTTVFSQTQNFYCLVELDNAPDDTVVKAVWTAISVEGADPNTLIDEVEISTGDSVVTFDLVNDQLWPTGQYKVDLYLNGEMDQTVNFQVQ